MEDALSKYDILIRWKNWESHVSAVLVDQLRFDLEGHGHQVRAVAGSPVPGVKDATALALTVIGVVYSGVKTLLALVAHAESTKRKVTLKFHYGDAEKTIENPTDEDLAEFARLAKDPETISNIELEIGELE